MKHNHHTPNTVVLSTKSTFSLDIAHAGFIINTGDATAQDVLDLAKYVTDKVYEKFGKKIEFEIKVLGL